jgi:zinc transporter ZupT
MNDISKQKRNWLPFLIGFIVALGVVVGMFVVTTINGAETAAEKATGATSGGAIAIVVVLCVIAAARRRKNEQK